MSSSLKKRSSSSRVRDDNREPISKKNKAESNSSREKKSTENGDVEKISGESHTTIFNEEEALVKTYSIDDDVRRQATSFDKLKRALRTILDGKEQNATSVEVDGERLRASLAILDLRQVSRLFHFRIKHARDRTNELKLSMDSRHLLLQNLLYEVENLEGQIERCVNFRSDADDIDLAPIDDFYASAPIDISRPSITKQSEHELTKARLHWELAQRKELVGHLAEKTNAKEEVEQSIAEATAMLDSLLPRLHTILEASKPVEEVLGMNVSKRIEQYQQARYLSSPLFSLYRQFDAVCNLPGRHQTGMSVAIEGDCEAAKNWQNLTAKEEEPLEEDDDDDDDEVDGESQKKHRKDRHQSKSTAAAATAASDNDTAATAEPAAPSAPSKEDKAEAKRAAAEAERLLARRTRLLQAHPLSVVLIVEIYGSSPTPPASPSAAVVDTEPGQIEDDVPCERGTDSPSTSAAPLAKRSSVPRATSIVRIVFADRFRLGVVSADVEVVKRPKSAFPGIASTIYDDGALLSCLYDDDHGLTTPSASAVDLLLQVGIKDWRLLRHYKLVTGSCVAYRWVQSLAGLQSAQKTSSNAATSSSTATTTAQDDDETKLMETEDDLDAADKDPTNEAGASGAGSGDGNAGSAAANGDAPTEPLAEADCSGGRSDGGTVAHAKELCGRVKERLRSKEALLRVVSALRELDDCDLPQSAHTLANYPRLTTTKVAAFDVLPTSVETKIRVKYRTHPHTKLFHMKLVNEKHEMVAIVQLPHTYPAMSPMMIFAPSSSSDTQKMFAPSADLLQRHVLSEVNLLHASRLPHAERNSVLLHQIWAVCSSLDVCRALAGTASPKGVYPRPTRGRDRARPLKYNPDLGIFVHDV